VTASTTMNYQNYKREEMLTVYSKNNCPFCDKAKHYLKTNGFVYEEIKIDEDLEAREWLINEGHRTAPQIYNNGRLLVEGGYQGLARLNAEQIQERIGATNA
jgi:glutaredoxin